MAFFIWNNAALCDAPEVKHAALYNTPEVSTQGYCRGGAPLPSI